MKRAVFLLILSSVLYTLMGVFVKLGAEEIPVMEQIFYRNIPLFLYTFYLLKRKGHSLLPEKGNRLFVFLRATVGFSAMSAFFYASAKLDLSVAQVLYRTSPMWIGLLAVVLLKEKYSVRKFIALIFAFLGAVVILRPQGYLGIIPGLIGLYSAFAVSFCYILVHLLSGRERPSLILFWFSLACIMLSGLFLPCSYVHPSSKQWVYLFFVALSGGLGQLTVTLAYQSAPAGEIGIYDYSGILISPFLGMLIFSEKIGWSKVTGIVLLLFAAWIHHGKLLLAKDNLINGPRGKYG